MTKGIWQNVSFTTHTVVKVIQQDYLLWCWNLVDDITKVFTSIVICFLGRTQCGSVDTEDVYFTRICQHCDGKNTICSTNKGWGGYRVKETDFNWIAYPMYPCFFWGLSFPKKLKSFSRTVPYSVSLVSCRAATSMFNLPISQSITSDFLLSLIFYKSSANSEHIVLMFVSFPS